MKKFLYLLTLLLMCAFASHAQDNQLVTSSYRVADSTKYKIKVLEVGDEHSFDRLCQIYEYDFVKILPYAFIIAELHKVENIDLDVYIGLFNYLELNKNLDREREEVIIKLAFYYLRKVLKTHNFSARLQLASFYKEGKYVEKNEAAEYLYNGGMI